MFEQTFVTPGKTRRDRTFAISLGLQAVAITGIALMPLLQVQPIEMGKRFLILPPSAMKPEPVEKQKQVQHTSGPAVPRQAVIRVLPRPPHWSRASSRWIREKLPRSSPDR